jgi:zinc transporter
MSLVFYSQVDNADDWRSALKAADPALAFHAWPDCGPFDEVEAVLAWKAPPGFYRQFPNLKLIINLGAGVDNIVRDATLQVDGIEDSLLLGRLQHKRGDLGKLRRVLVRLQRLLAPEPGALFRLLRQPPRWINDNDLDELRQSTEEFSLVLRDLAALQERIKLLQEEIAAQVGEQTNRSVFTLTVVTVLALPINIIAGLLGMNVGGIPMADNPRGFLFIALIVLSFTVVAGWLAFRRRE